MNIDFYKTKCSYVINIEYVLLWDQMFGCNQSWLLTFSKPNVRMLKTLKIIFESQIFQDNQPWILKFSRQNVRFPSPLNIDFFEAKCSSAIIPNYWLLWHQMFVSYRHLNIVLDEAKCSAAIRIILWPNVHFFMRPFSNINIHNIDFYEPKCSKN